MNKKVLVIPIVLIFATILVVPAIAEPTKGLKVPATLLPGPQVSIPSPERTWVTNGGILQIRGDHTDFYPVTLTIGNDIYPDGTSRNFGNFIVNLKNGWLKSRGYGELTFPSVDGGFAGEIVMKMSYFTLEYSIHGVLHGFGDFEGQTLMYSYNGPIVGALWTGYCLKG